MRFCRVVLPLVLGLPLYGGSISIAAPVGTTFTTSFVQVDTNHDTAVGQQMDTFSLQLIARLQGGPVLYSQSFSVPFANPTFQTAIGTAQGVLTGAGALTFLGPMLQSSSTALVNSVPQTVVDNVVTTQIVGVLDTLGPNAITIGDFGICQSYVFGVGAEFDGPYALGAGCTLAGTPYVVVAGTSNIDARSLTLNDIFTTTTTTNTFLTTQSYEIIGLTAATPEPASFGLLAIGLSGLLVARQIRRSQKRTTMLRYLALLLCAALTGLAAPPRISYATYLGGGGTDVVGAIVSDAAGNYYVAAQTNSSNYPRLPANQSFAGNLDIVVSKFSPTNALIYSTVIGGSSDDTPFRAAVDSDGSVYVTFTTTSTNFPKPSGSVIGGGVAGTGVLKLNPAGVLTAVALLAAPAATTASGLTLDSNHNVWITGGTTGFAGQTGAIQANVAGGTDIFVARLNNELTQIGYFTYLGTAAEESANRIAVDDTGNVFVSGNGGATNFPTGSGKAFPGPGSFVVKLDPVNNKVLFATFITAGNGGSGLVLDGADVWTCANSNGTNFTPTADALQTIYGGGFNDSVLVRLNASDGQIRYATYFGGSGGDFANGLARDPSGNMILYGNTGSANLPVTSDALRKTPGTSTTAFIAVVDGGGRLVYCSYLGGSGTFDFGLDVTADPQGNVFGIGATTSSDFPTTPGSFQPTLAGGQDVYVARIEFVAPADPNLVRAAIQNAASFRGGAIAPGEVITIYPGNVGPAGLVTAALTADRRIATLIGSTRVLFDDTPAPMVYTVAGQVSLVVPYGVQGKSFTRIVVEYNGVKSRPMAIPVTAVAPGVFTVGSGTGPAALLNENGSVNSAQNAAARGSIIVFFATGEGQTNPAGVDGRLNEFTRLEDFPQPLQTPKVTIGGQPAVILYAGAAPSYLAGLMQFNVRVPDNILPGPSVTLEIAIGSTLSQPGVTVAVR